MMKGLGSCENKCKIHVSNSQSKVKVLKIHEHVMDSIFAPTFLPECSLQVLQEHFLRKS